MADRISQFPLGDYYTYPTDESAVLGQIHEEQNTNIGDAGALGAATTNSGSMIKCMLVKNNSGGILVPGYAGKFSVATDGFTGMHEITGVETAVIGNVAGMIDPFITGTIPDGALFNVVISGAVPFICKAAIAKGDTIVPGASGRWIKTVVGDFTSVTPTYPFAYGKCLKATATDEDEGLVLLYPKLI